MPNLVELQKPASPPPAKPVSLRPLARYLITALSSEWSDLEMQFEIIATSTSHALKIFQRSHRSYAAQRVRKLWQK